MFLRRRMNIEAGEDGSSGRICRFNDSWTLDTMCSCIVIVFTHFFAWGRAPCSI